MKKINPRIIRLLKQIVFIIVVSLFVFGGCYGCIMLSRKTKINYTHTFIEKSIMNGTIIGVIDDELEENDPSKQFIVNIKIDGETYSINNQQLYDEFLYKGVKSELFVVYNRLTIKKKDQPPTLIERTIFSIFE